MDVFLVFYFTTAIGLFLMMLFPPTLALKLEKKLQLGRCKGHMLEIYVIMAIVALFWPLAVLRSFFE